MPLFIHMEGSDFVMNEPDQRLLDLPPSAKLVFAVLGEEGPLTQKQIAKKSRLAQRTVRYAVRRLEEIDAITEEMNFMDARQMIYTTTRDHPVGHDQESRRDACRS